MCSAVLTFRYAPAESGGRELIRDSLLFRATEPHNSDRLGDADPESMPDHSTYATAYLFCTVEATCRGSGTYGAVARVDATPCSHRRHREEP